MSSTGVASSRRKSSRKRVLPRKRIPLTVRWRFVDDRPGIRDSYNHRCRDFNNYSRDPKGFHSQFYFSNISNPRRRYRPMRSGRFWARVLPDTVRVIDLRNGHHALEMEVVPVIRTETFDSKVDYQDDPRWT